MAAPQGTADPIRILVERGTEALREGDLRLAEQAFNTALKLNPSSSALHTLNSLVYHRFAARGDARMSPLAEAGYRIALDQDPGNWVAARQLGRLLLESDRCEEALDFLGIAVGMEPDDADTMQRIAICAWRTRDLRLARTASAKAIELGATSPDALSAAAVIAAGTGDSAEADRYWTMAAATMPRGQAEAVRSRITRLERVSSQLIAEGAGQPRRADLGHEITVGGKELGPLPPQAKYQPDSGESRESSDALGSQEEILLPALARPADGTDVPLMAMFTVSIIRTTEAVNDARGVNLLSQLALSFNLQRTYERRFEDSAEGPVSILQKGFSLNPGSNILYSLNIANAATDEAEVLARPTLVALDGVPSTFFSGSELSIALEGGFGSAGELVQKPIGVSLSVTPTFVDHDTVMLAVRTSRQFLEFQTNSAPSLNQTLQTARNSVSANVALRFGETLVLSGLNEKETTQAKAGVPLLRDIPGLQYLFSTDFHEQFQSTVLILITPRRPAYTSDAGDRAELAMPDREQRYRRLRRILPHAFDPDDNLDAIIRGLQGNTYFEQYRQGDVRAETWLSDNDLKHSISRTLGYLYY